MSNSPDMVVAMVQQLRVDEARKVFNEIKRGLDYSHRHIELIHRVEKFFESVELIQEKTIKQIPALFKKV